MEQLVILLIIGLISLVNWLMQKASERREAAKEKRLDRREEKKEQKRNIYTQPAPATPPVGRRAPAERDPFKELMDALGLPADEAPPHPVVPVPEVFEEEEFASLEEPAPPPLPKAPIPPKVAGQVWRKKWTPRPDRKTQELASAFAAVEEEKEPAYRGGGIRSMLAGPDGRRKAVVLSEILGTPRGLAPTEALMTRGHL